MPFVIVLLIVAGLVAIVVLVLVRNRSASSSVDSFRRHIDALGPEARRTVVDQVQSAAGRSAEPDAGPEDVGAGDVGAGDEGVDDVVDADTADGAAPPATDDTPGDPPDDAGGARGT